VNENIEATGFSKVSKDTLDVYPCDAAMVAVGDCTIMDGVESMPDAERLPDTEGLAAGTGEFSVLTELRTGDAAAGKLGICGTGGAGEG
jgi:hypothetical protein